MQTRGSGAERSIKVVIRTISQLRKPYMIFVVPGNIQYSISFAYNVIYAGRLLAFSKMKPVAPFVPALTLEDHTDTITALAFSPTGNELASGSDDGSVIIYEPLVGSLKYRTVFQGGILSLAWDPRHLARLFVGCNDGTLAIVDDFKIQDPSSSVLTGIKSPIFALSVDEYSGDIAIAVGSEIHIAKEITPRNYVTIKIFPPPSELVNTMEEADKRVRGRAIMFREKGSELVVAYLNHGVVCWDVVSQKELWRIQPIHSHRHLGHAALSPDQKLVLVSNLGTGVDIYELGRSHPVLRLKTRPAALNRNVPLQVACLSGGVVSGAPDGSVHIWRIPSGNCLQVLEHNGDMVQSVAVFEYPTCTLVVTATSRMMQDTYIKTWRAKNESNIITTVCRTAGLYLWSQNVTLKCLIRSMVIKQVPLFPVFVVATMSILFHYFLSSPGTSIASYEPLLSLLDIMKQLQIRNLKLGVGAAVRRMALNIVEYIYRMLQDQEQQPLADRKSVV